MRPVGRRAGGIGQNDLPFGRFDRRGIMRPEDLDLDELLDVDAEHGVIRFAGARAILLDAVAMGLLREQLVEAFGAAAARAIFTRFGFAHGYRMAEAMGDAFTWDRPEDWRDAGGRIHVLQGLLCLSPGGGPLSPRGARVEGSYEAEQHLLHLGRADAPVCWTLTGFASGYLSRTEGRDIYVIERRCVGRGDAACQFVGRSAEGWGAELDAHRPFFAEGGLGASLDRIGAMLRRAERRLRTRERAAGSRDDPSGIVARSAPMRLTLDLARRVAKVDSTVLVTGESGAGKERVARLVHDASARAGGPFVAVNCGAIPEALLESELFGHARGAFTGASHDRVGLFEAAAGGTLFLDEVGELPAGTQVKLLRALQERSVRRVGENRSRPVDARIVAATNKDLAEEVAARRFRRDLYYRLRVVELRVPPLRDRREDLLPLARALLEEAAARMKRPPLRLTPAAADQLARHPWPGNVRELANAMERAVALAPRPRVQIDDLPEEVRRAAPIPSPAAGVRPLEEIERDYILAALEQNGGNRTETAEQLGVGASTLYRKLKRYARRRGR
jgi:two-component system response regulator HydG